MKSCFSAVLSFAALATLFAGVTANEDGNLGAGRRRTHEQSRVRQGIKNRSGENNHVPRVDDAGSPRAHQANRQQLPCVLILREIEFADGHHEGNWRCELHGYDAEIAGGEPGDTVMASIEGIDRILKSNPGVVSHVTTFFSHGARIHGKRIIISEEDELLFGEVPHHQRRLALKTGDLKTLIVRVTSNDGTVFSSATDIANTIFGLNGVSPSLSAVANGCSWNGLDIVPATGADITNGVLEMNLDATVKGGECEVFCETILKQVMKKYSISAAEGLKSKFDLVQVVLPDGSGHYDDLTWVAHADFGGVDSCFNDYTIRYPNLAMHETGHNWGLEHANENGEAYGDDSGAMGSAPHGEDFGKVCFNGGHSWVLGWYYDYNIEVDPLAKNFDGKLAGVGKYPGIGDDEYVVLKLTASSAGNYYIMFNHKIGVNADTVEGENTVTVVTMKDSTMTSLKAKLAAGKKYAIPNFEGKAETVTIEVVSIDSSSSGFAHVRVYKGASPSPPTTTAEDEPANEPDESECTDLEDWQNEYGDSCAWYDDEDPGCPETKDELGYLTDDDASVGIPASKACCQCKK